MTEVVSTRLPLHEKRLVQALAAKRELSVSNVVREAVTDLVARELSQRTRGTTGESRGNRQTTRVLE